MIRSPTSQELTQLRRSFDRWGVFDFMKLQKVLINHDRAANKRDVLVISKGSLDVLEKANLQPKEIGLTIGQIRSKKFVPSLPGAEIIAKHSIGFPYIVVNRTAEALVLYGRDIFGESVVEVSKNLDQNQVAIILNQDRESIGIGQPRFTEDNLFKKGEVTVYTLLDAGIYLRNQGD